MSPNLTNSRGEVKALATASCSESKLARRLFAVGSMKVSSLLANRERGEISLARFLARGFKMQPVRFKKKQSQPAI